MVNPICKQLGIKYPIVGAPMFLCSNMELVAAVSNAGGVGCFPAMNYRTPTDMAKDIDYLRTLTDKPFGVNLIVNSAAQSHMEPFFRVCLDKEVPLYITSLGGPAWMMDRAHKSGAVVWCDVTTLAYAKKVEALGADAVVAVTSEAGGHAGPNSADEFVPKLCKELSIPVLQAGGIADAKTVRASFKRGSSAAYVGTRFLASEECQVSDAYKEAIVKAKLEDIVMTDILSGTPCAVINTDYVQRIGELRFPWKQMMRYKPLKKIARAYLA